MFFHLHLLRLIIIFVYHWIRTSYVLDLVLLIEIQLIIVLIAQEIVRLILSIKNKFIILIFFLVLNYITRNPCFPNICLNGGTCTVVNGVATCTCPAYFTGTRCDQCKCLLILIYHLNNVFLYLIVYGCNPVTNPQAITCANRGTCSGNTCICASNSTIGTLCEIRMFI